MIESTLGKSTKQSSNLPNDSRNFLVTEGPKKQPAPIVNLVEKIFGSKWE